MSLNIIFDHPIGVLTSEGWAESPTFCCLKKVVKLYRKFIYEIYQNIFKIQCIHNIH